MRININVDLANTITQRESLIALRHEAPDLFDNLVFEITEEVLCEIDDFGIGKSGFARLSRLPFWEVEIDRSIVNGCANAPARKVMIGSIITMAHNLGARVDAEGVERPEDLAFLGQAGCDAVQGYLVARPMQFEKLQSFVEEFNQAFGVRSTIPSPSAMPAAFG